MPNHIKFETEISVLSRLQKMQKNDSSFFSSMQLQVFSFTRLAWYFLQNSDSYSPEILNESAISMILQKILNDCKTDLTVFRGEVNHPGFIKTLGELFNEFLQGNIGSADISDIIDNLGDTSQEIDLKHKLSDLELLFSNYVHYLLSRDLQSVQLVDQLVDYLESFNLENAMFVISGFTRFTANESMLLECILRRAGEIRLALILDKSYYDKLPSINNLFFNSGKTYYYYYNFSRKNSIQINRDKILDISADSISQGMNQLDLLWRNMYTDVQSNIKFGQNSDIHIWAAENSTAEIVTMAKKIHYLVSTSSLRYKDIRILTRDIPHYKLTILPLFMQNNIPVSFQDEIKMSHHPLVAFLQSLFLIKKNFFRYKDIFRFLRTRLFLPAISGEESTIEYQTIEEVYQDKIDITENVVLAYGYEGNRWRNDDDWSYVAYSSDENVKDKSITNQRISNEIRNDIKNALVPFFSKLDSCKTGKDGAICLYNFLIEQRIDNILIFWRNAYVEQGLLDEARIHEQAWQEFIRLLDDYVMIFGKDMFDINEFETIFSTGLENTTYSKVPSTIDQISVSSLDTIHGEKKKVTFIIGLTENILPLKAVNSTLLSDTERIMLDNLLSDDIYLQQTSYQTISQEPFVAYMAFMSSSEQLYLSYPLSNSNNDDTKPSPYISSIMKAFQLTNELKMTHPNLSSISIQEISTVRQLFSDIVVILKEANDLEKSLPPFWEYLLSFCKNKGHSSSMFNRITKSLSAQNIPQSLSRSSVNALYGDTLYTSVSQIENFYNCEYKYLLRYGLKLYEREKFGLNPIITGDFFHESLDKMMKFVIKNNLDIEKLSEEEWGSCINSIIVETLEESRFNILSATSRMKYISFVLSNTIKKVGWAFKKQAERTNMKTLKTELTFGNSQSKNELKGLEFLLPNERILKVRGKIDRLDTLLINNKSYLFIVDYKSSNHKFDYRNVYYGLAMQMVTYLDVAIDNSFTIIGSKAEPAGAFYLHILDPILKPNEIGKTIDNVLLKKYQYNGILINNDELLDGLDIALEEKESSPVYPFKKLASGKGSSTQFVTPRDIENLREHIHLKFQEAGSKIFEGSTKLNPAYQDKTRISCQNCEFRSICQFDVLLPENNYSRIDKIKKEEVLKKISFDVMDGE